ncbi:MAG TPA: sulfatase-like hydrolase/transferase [Patescibacteria group bacterium]|nr:sulfatase-like hydrolase/transferase [Patescibacteria group bacterium]
MQPNILFIMTDQQRFDSLGCYGNEAVSTFNLDNLAEEGALFKNCYVNNPICTPSRASIFTGKPVIGHGVNTLYDVLPQEEVLFPERLRQRGYATALIGKLHVSGAMFEKDKRNKFDGFDIYDWCHEPSLFTDGKFNAYSKWLREAMPESFERLERLGRKYANIPEEAHFSHWTAEATIKHIKERDKEKPFFFYMSLFDPHNPYDQHPKNWEDVVNKDKILTPNLLEGETLSKPEGIRQEHHHGYMGSFYDKTPQDIYDMRLGYYAAVSFLDYEIGRVLKTLEEEGISENTLVIFTSDHGDMLGDHELYVKGAYFYDPCTKVPLIIKYPGELQAGSMFNQLVQPSDIAATVLKAGGYTAEEVAELMSDSKDIIEAVKNSEASRKIAVCEYRATGINDEGKLFDPPIHATMLRDERFKLCVYHGDKEHLGELYDMNEDPLEKNNLWNDSAYADIKVNMLLDLLNWQVETEVRYHGSRGGVSERVNSIKR